LLLFGGYFLLLKAVDQNKLQTKQIWRLIFITAGILCLAYNAFSYDLFNYIFDAKIVTYYHLNPYQYKALDFPADPMLGFMHWTHRLYPYGPVWLALTIPFSFLGFQKFLLTAILFKALAAAGYLLSSWSIAKITKSNLALAFFAFNPLVIIEGLASAHNDMVMVGLALAALYFLESGKKVFSWFLFILSVGTKFATLALLPLFFVPQKSRSLAFFLMVLPLVAVSVRTEVQPWYLLYLIPFAALLPRLKYFILPLTLIAFGWLLTYLPFLYLGNWSPPVPAIKTTLITASVLLAGLLIFLQKINLVRR
jgi:hypothetical protein